MIKESKSQQKTSQDYIDAISFKLLSNTIGQGQGYTGGRKTRCTDKFVRYPYPKNLGTGYQKDFCRVNNKSPKELRGEAFNLEKEAKIINPHRMDMNTTANTHFKKHNVKPVKRAIRMHVDEQKPILGQSLYQKSFPNWQNGHGDVYHEKHPQYPFYSLPFKGESSY